MCCDCYVSGSDRIYRLLIVNVIVSISSGNWLMVVVVVGWLFWMVIVCVSIMFMMCLVRIRSICVC